MSLQILIVDDDPTIKILHKAIVVRSKLADNPLTFSDGKEAFEYLKAFFNPEVYYLVLLDINMPVMNGWEFLNEIHETHFAKNLYIIMVTSSVDSGDRIRASTFPQVIGFLEKPLRMDTCNNIKTMKELTNFYQL
jgi:CheY-like chemotaxis protein